MVNTSKILTVSYGTFSCTLEGFDDSFDTMKAIAEYFRDLAADDRYFGAEPPTPDAEMLARIAEREISRRVEASQKQGQIVLRAHPHAEPPAPAASAPAETAAPLAAAAAIATPDITPEAPGASAPLAPAPLTEAETESEAPTEPQTALSPEAEPEIEEIDADDFFDAATAEDAIEEDAIEDTTVEDDVAAQTAFTPVPHPDQNSVAAKLQRIRAVVARTEKSDSSFSEDEHAEDYLATATAELDAALETDDHAEPSRPALVAAETADLDEDDDFEQLLRTLAKEDLSDAALPSEDTTAAKDLSHDDDLADDSFEAEVEDEDDGDDTLFGDDDDDEAEDLIEAPAAQSPLRARVVKMKREDFQAAVLRGDFEEYDDEDDQDDDLADTATTSTLSPEAEADLQRELAELDSEISVASAADAALDTGHDLDDLDAENEGDDSISDTNLFASDEDEDEDEDDERSASDNAFSAVKSTIARATFEDTGAEQDLGRIMAKADSQLAEPEGKNRRNAIAHLRAAVAATLAEKKAGSDLSKPDTATAVYQDDLANVVRPRRPQMASETARSQRPAEPRPAPLKLVAEQRIDAGQPQAPVMPRRISRADLAARAAAQEAAGKHDIDTSGGFLAFAEEMGATRLPDLLEAAAAYLSFVEGVDQFSRPQLMNKVRQIGNGDISREDGLRSFGQLLRQGKIQKLKGGRFTVSDRINFKPDERKLG